MEPSGWTTEDVRSAAKRSATTPKTTESSTKPRNERHSACPRENLKALLHDSVELSPGGHRKHTLQRTSPGGTTRSTQYVSPLKGDVTSLYELDDGLLPFEQDIRRCDAINEVPGMQTGAQRSARARAKRKAAAAPRTSFFPDEAAALRQQDAERKRMKPATDEPEVSPPTVEPEVTPMPPATLHP